MGKFAVAILTTTALGFIAGNASAADLPRYEAPLYAPSQHIWTGLYFGLNAGGAFGTFSATSTFGPLSADLGSVNASGFIGGGQVGAQIQYEHLLFGVEGDFQGSSQDHTDSFSVSGVPVSVSASMPWFATFRGRVGWAFDSLLLYGTGGLAIIDGKLSASALGLTASTEDSHNGWTAGGGLEWAFAPNWSAKVEYLYLESGNIDIGSSGGVTLNGRIKDNIVRLGLNYYIFD